MHLDSIARNTSDISNAALKRMFQHAPGFVALLTGPKHVIEVSNEAFGLLVGLRDIASRPIREALPELNSQGYVELLDRVAATGEPFVGRGIRLVLQRQRSGPSEEAFVDIAYQPMTDEQGRVTGILVQGQDVTAMHQARQEMQDISDRLEDMVAERTQAIEHAALERRLADSSAQNAQKLEAVGKLTGGVAHDFNNVLQVIGGNLELLRADGALNDIAQRRLRSAQGAVDKGARLASQLLAFARRQPLEPAVIDVSRMLTRLDDLMRRMLGEAIDLETVAAKGLWLVNVDPIRLENVLVDLVMNARDAMPAAGRLTIEAGNAVIDERYASLHADVQPGEYLLITVSDTGVGMSDAVQQRAFEPFFTTKPGGQGTGLGLSMVYGFVRQSGGHIKIYSEVGHGTAIKIYLPRSLEVEAELANEASLAPVGGEETVLVVEDDAEVRSTAVQTLTALGYSVLQAHDAQSALAILNSGVHVDLLFTDVVMPGELTSTELANRARSLVPGLEVLFTSGYTEGAIVHGGRVDPGVQLLTKPYRRDDLARKLRHVLRKSAEQPVEARQTDLKGNELQTNYDVLSVLYVEDHEDTRMAIGECLEALGHNVVMVASAEDAITQTGTRSFDVLFTDITLPGMSGIELAAKLASEQPRTRVIVASGYGRDARVDALGPEALVLQKPYDIAAMETALQKVGRSLEAFDSKA